MEPEEHAVVPVQEDDTHKSPIQQHAPDHYPELHTSVPDKHIEASQTRRNIIYNLGQKFSTYAQECALVYTIQGEVIATNTIIPRRTRIYANVAVSDTDTIYVHQAMKENDAHSS